MSTYFCLSIRFLDPTYHGRRDGGVLEWPPSPLRVFQALVAAASARWRVEGLDILPAARDALNWLQQQTAPIIISSPAVSAFGYGISVPNNATDIVAKAWCRGNESNTGDASTATHRTMKTVKAMLLPDVNAVHYLWTLKEPLTDDILKHADILSEITHSIVSLGWGVDMAVACSRVIDDGQADSLAGERWMPGIAGKIDGLRVPTEGTLNSLMERHRQFINRIGSDGLTFIPPEPLSTYKLIEYRDAYHPPTRRAASFSLLKLDGKGYRAFETARSALKVAGMMRHATETAARNSGWPGPRINSFVLGHGEAIDNDGHRAVGPRRFAFLPLPSIEARGENRSCVVGSVRRAMLTTFAEDCEVEVDWARRALSGQDLIDEHKKSPLALLSLVPENEKIIRCYTQSASTWATVTPVVLPGFDDPAHYRRRLNQKVSENEQKILLGRLINRIDGLLRKAITQACFPQALADYAELDWCKAGYWPGNEIVDRYGVPDHLRRFPLYHVKIHWRSANGESVNVNGPICIGGGRFYGLGLFAAFK